MAKFLSPIISRGSGKIAGLVISHNKGGMYLRAATIPTNPGTPQQVAVQGFLSQLNTDWEDLLTQAERDDWDVYATNTPLIDQFGDPRTVTGLNMFQRYNIPALQGALAKQVIAPATYNLGGFTPVTMAASEGAGFSFSFDNTDAWANEDGSSLLVYASRPQNVGIKFFKSPYRFMGKIDGDAITPPTSPQVFAAVPFAFVEGQKMFTKVRGARADGRLSTIQRNAFVALA